MGKTSKILRQSIFLFLQNYHHFTSGAPTFLAFPFAIFALLSRFYVPSSNVFPLIHTRLRSSLLIASGSRIISSDLIGVRLSQTILTYIFVSPFTYSSLLLAKSSVIIEFLNQKNPKQASSKPSLISIFKPLVFTQVLNSLLIMSVNAVCFFVLFICFSFLDHSRLSSRGTLAIFSSIGAIAYSFMLAYAYIICNLSLVVSGLEKRGGFVPVLKACALMHGSRSPSSTAAVSLAVLMNTALVGVEALFHYRVLSACSVAIDSAIVMEGLFIAYMYAILLVLDTVITCVFWKRWGEDYQIDREDYYYMYYSHDQEKLLP